MDNQLPTGNFEQTAVGGPTPHNLNLKKIFEGGNFMTLLELRMKEKGIKNIATLAFMAKINPSIFYRYERVFSPRFDTLQKLLKVCDNITVEDLMRVE